MAVRLDSISVEHPHRRRVNRHALGQSSSDAIALADLLDAAYEEGEALRALKNEAESRVAVAERDADRWRVLATATDREALDRLAGAADIIALQHQIPLASIQELVQSHRGWIALIDAVLGRENV